MKLVKLVAAVGQRGSPRFNILLAAAHPSAFGSGNGIGPQVVLSDDVGFGRSLAVVPQSADGSRHLAVSLVGVVDVALVDAHKVGKHIEVVDVVISTVDVGQSVDFASRRPPHLRHVDIGQTGLADGNSADGIPHHHASVQCFLHILRHLVHEGSRGAGLVASDVKVGSVGEGLGQLVQQCLEHHLTLVAVHGEAHSRLERLAMSRHVYFRNDGETALSSVSLQFRTLCLRVVLSGKACHVGGLVQLRV